MATVNIGGIKKEYEVGTRYETIADEYQGDYDDLIALVVVNGKMIEMQKKLQGDCEISFLTLKDSAGHKSYVRTALFVLLKAANDVLGEEGASRIKVEFAIGKGYYCNGRDDVRFDEAFTEKVRERMQELVKANLPIKKESIFD